LFNKKTPIYLESLQSNAATTKALISYQATRQITSQYGNAWMIRANDFASR